MVDGKANKMDLNILYEDNHILVAIKPAGILSQADKTNDNDMLTILKKYLKEKYNKPGNVYLGLVHRLDRMVSGIMVFARTSKSASRLSEQIRQRVFSKGYLAVVHGKINQCDTLKNYLLKDNSNNIVTVVNNNNGNKSKLAELSYQLVEYKNNFSLVKINLKTGRPHQIRVQFSNINHPLYGDKKYGITNDKNNIALFANYLSFLHPTTKEVLKFEVKPCNIFPFNLFGI